MGGSTFRWVAAKIAVSCALGGCAPYGARPLSPAHGGHAWVEASSAHFRVVADVDADDARALAQELEQALNAIDQVAFESARVPLAPTTVVVFESESDFHAFQPALVEGKFFRKLPNDLEPARVMLLHGSLARRSRISCLHELTHDLFERNFGPAPPWLNEGWAQYFSTIEVEPDRVRVGVALPQLTFTADSEPFAARASDGTTVLAMPVTQVVPPSQLLRLSRQEFYRAAELGQPSPEDELRETSLYLGAWAFVHMLHDGEEPYSSRFKQFLNGVRSERVNVAWARAFAGINEADLDRDFRRYLAKRELAVYEYGRRKEPQAEAIAVRTLPDSDVHVLWARLSSWQGDAGKLAKLDLDEAVKGAPKSAEARYFRGLCWLRARNFAAAEADLLGAEALAPNDPRYLLATLALRVEEQRLSKDPLHAREAVLKAAQALTPVARTPLQLEALAATYLGFGQPAIALPFAERASQLAPIDSSLLDTEARALAALGRTSEALNVERAAIAFVPEAADAATLFSHLQEYERQLKSAPAK